MSYRLTIPISADQAGLTWSAQLVDAANANVGPAITTGFSASGTNYIWDYDQVPDSFTEGSIVFTADNGMEFASIVSSSGSSSGSGETASARYGEQSDIEDKFGIGNVAQWSRLDANATETDTNRIQRACDYACDQIDNALRDGPYEIPLGVSSGRATVTNWFAVFAGVWLYENRGGHVNDEGKDTYIEMKKAVEKEIELYRSGRRRLDAARIRSPLPTAPTVIM